MTRISKYKHALTLVELHKILFFCLKKMKKIKTPLTKFLILRNMTMFFLIYFIGLRPKECTNIKLDDLDLTNKTLYIPAQNNKQRQSDLMPIPEFIYFKLMEYLHQRNIFYGNSIWAFPSSRGGNSLDRSQFVKIFRNALRDAGLYKVSYKDKKGLNRGEITLYSLRRGFGTLVYSKTKDIKKTATLLRHKDQQFRSTMLYIYTTQDRTKKNLMEEVYNETPVFEEEP